MVRKKSSFVDKKTASVYHVVRRSQRDVGTEATAETLSDFVLMPSPENAAREGRRTKKAAAPDGGASAAAEGASGAGVGGAGGGTTKVGFDALKSRIAAAGLADDAAATYAKFTKPIERGGTFVPSNILHEENADNLRDLFMDSSRNELDTALEEAMAVNEVGRMLDSIALTADCMEDDMAQALFDFEEGGFEEILDDFCFTANQEPVEGEDGEEEGFNYEKHVAGLMEKARAQDAGETECNREVDDDFFGGTTPLHGRIEEEDDADDFDYDQYGELEENEEDMDSIDREFSGKDYSKPAATNDEQQRMLCQKFEEALLEYDSDDVGDLNEECEDIVGDRPLDGDRQLDAALEEFLTEKEDDILIMGAEKTEKRTGGSGYSALVGTTMLNASELNNDPSTTLQMNIEESKKQMAADLADADAVLANPEMDLPPEEVFIDGKSYFTATSRNQWDCESILSTYSNLDNNPAVIGRKKKKKKGKKGKDEGVAGFGDAIPEEAPAKILLSAKTGLPIEYNNNPEEEYPEDDYYGESDTFLSVNRGEARDKSESKFEKKNRKIAIKEERKICRMQKKMMKEAFAEEFQSRGQAVAVDAVGGKTVFRFT